MAAVSCGPKGQLALLVDEASQQRFLVDTGSSYSILPHKSQQPHSGLRLCTADRSPIPCWGGRKVHMAAGGRRFSWTFLLADVALPIIGADFLKHFGLLVDIGEMRLLARGGGWKHHLVGPSANGLFATLGVVADQSSSSSSSSPSSSPSLPTVEARSSGSSLQHVLEEFPGVLNTSKVLPKPTHRVEYILVTEGRPVKAIRPSTGGWTTPDWKLPRRSLRSWKSRGSSGGPTATGHLPSTW